MPNEGKLFGLGAKAKIKPLGLNDTYGLLGFAPSGLADGKKIEACGFSVCTGTPTVPDITFNQAANVNLVNAADVPSNMRCYLTRLDIDVRGNTPWSGGNYVMVQDSNNAPLVYLPVNALRGMSAYTFPDSDTEFAIVVTAASYAASTGVITLPATSLVNSAYGSNCICTVIGGTGIGQSALISSNTSTTITPVGGAAAFPVALDATSVIAVWYWIATAGAAGNVTLTNQSGAANPLPAGNALDNGYNTIVVSGTGVGQVRPISANTTSVVAAAYNYNTAPDTTSLIHITNESNLWGALDLCVGDKWPAAGLGQGLQVAVAGSMAAGSPIRVYAEGYFAP